MGKNVVITGIGIVSSVGIGRKNYWDALIQGKTGFSGRLAFLIPHRSMYLLQGRLPILMPSLFSEKGLRELDRSTRLLNVAAKLAIDDAGFEIAGDYCSMTGVSVGSTFGSLHSISQFDQVS